MKRLALATIVLFTATLAYTTVPAIAQQPAKSAITVPISGAGGGGTFAGTFQLQKFATDSQGKLVATGLLTGIVTDTATGVATSIVRTVSLPAAVSNAAQAVAAVPGAAAASCGILHLELGPLNLDLLGLQVSLNRVILDITAVPGAGNLLGNLLCFVAGLLDNPSGLATLLNQILGALGL